MGDTPHQPGAPAEYHPVQESSGLSLSSGVGPSHTTADCPSVYPSPPSEQQPTAQLEMSQQQPRSSGPFDMNGMASALPQQQQQHNHHQQPAYRAAPYSNGPQRYNAAAMPSPGAAVQPPVPHMGPAPTHQYYLAQQAHMAQYYPTPLSPQQPSASLPARADMNYYAAAPMIVNQQHHPGPHYYYQAAAHYPGQGPHVQAQLQILGQYPQPHPQAHPQHQLQEPHSDQPHQQPQPYTQPHQLSQQHGDHGSNNLVQPGTFPPKSRQPSVVRGPPRKPRQSGHAIWIGNLPPQTELMALVHHVCKETDGLESLFLISKSSCAFANFRDEESSIAAQRKLHDSKFMMVKLVSRLRKSTVEGPAGVTAPTGPAAASSQHTGPTSNQAATESVTDTNGNHEPPTASTPTTTTTTTVNETPQTAAAEAPAVKSPPTTNGTATQKDRFFILKSLTIEDLDLSVKTNIWATQSHNEQTLNQAFKSAENVYLVFSANKSGEYYGYARMTSAINDDPAAAIEFAPKAHSTADVDLPKAIPTEATEFAPKGRIIDDSARGTIFWEADDEDQTTGADSNGNSAAQDEEGSGASAAGGDTGSVKSSQEGTNGEVKAWGKPFQLEWLSTNRLPFYRTRGLRNPWNSNREVKIARDGTELEPSVGRKLIGLFNRVQSPAIGVVPGMIPPHVVTGGPRVPIAVTMPGFVPMRLA
ncbi:zinc finger CCCH domain-containing protein 45 [Cladorrhinum samala]|uniref:Zinc finger CCCH domain-containing protein 45 n=1 Tax=Cladorrhinum samala TaxID=585594 RepID=A0AAV9HHM1_9PEZI|nr:zinc finger CCCH domain-containing protein 45 [Cladorrhinum samala]